MERFAKTKLQNKDPAGLSAIEPVAYQKRFHHFIESVFTGMNHDQLGSTYSSSSKQCEISMTRSSTA